VRLRRARKQHGVGPRRAGNVGGLHFASGIGGLIRDRAVVEKIAQRSGLDGKIDILRNIARCLDHAQRIELRADHADNIAATVVQRSTAVARLNRRTDLQETRVVMQARQRADDPRRHRQVGGEKTMQGIADRDDLVARIHRAAADRRDILFLEFFCSLQERKVVFFVGGDDAQFDWGLPDEIAMDVADAVGDDVIVGDDMRGSADDETAA
jgi:hypothetical protein